MISTAFGMPLMAAHSEASESGVILRVRRGEKSAWLVSSDGRKVMPPATIVFKIPLTYNLRVRTGLKTSPLLATVSDGKLIFLNGIAVPLAELEHSIRLRVA